MICKKNVLVKHMRLLVVPVYQCIVMSATVIASLFKVGFAQIVADR